MTWLVVVRSKGLARFGPQALSSLLMLTEHEARQSRWWPTVDTRTPSAFFLVLRGSVASIFPGHQEDNTAVGSCQLRRVRATSQVMAGGRMRGPHGSPDQDMASAAWPASPLHPSLYT
jgi:hypothetical protein